MAETGGKRLSPYKGLIPYGEEDAEFFFGRDKEKRLICANLFASSLSVLYGPSGVGKSSVLQAGVAPWLKKREDILLAAFNTWQSDPLAEIKAALSKAFLPYDPPEESDPLPQYLLNCSKMLDRRLMIIFDQFEEYFLFRESEDQFTEEFSIAVNRSDLPVSFLISIREDSIAKLDRFEGRIPTLFDCILRIEHLNRSSARDAILKPVDQYNKLLAADEPPYVIESDLVDEVLEQVQPGRVAWSDEGAEPLLPRLNATPPISKKSQIETPFLQLVMMRLWEEETSRGSRVLKLKTLRDLGDADKIVGEYLDTTMESLLPAEQNIVARAFKYLVTTARRKIAYQALEVADLEQLDKNQVTEVLEKLSDRRILNAIPADEQGGERRYEISHDVLSSAIKSWRLRYEMKQKQIEAQKKLEAEQKEAQRRLEAEAQERLNKESHKARVRERWVVVLTLFSVLLLFLVGLSNELRRTAKEAQAEAERQKVKAGNALKIVQALDSNLPYFKAIMRGHKNVVNTVSFSPDGKIVVTASGDSTAGLWNSETGEILREMSGHKGAVNSAVFSPDGTLILTASEDKTARLWNVETGEVVYDLGDQGSAVNYAAFNRDGNRVVTASVDGTARIWDLANRQGPVELKGHTGAIFTAVFNQNGDRVVTASADKTARIWDARTGTLLNELQKHVSAVNSASFSPDGNYVVTASADFTALVWNIAGGQREPSIINHSGPVTSATFSPSGKYIVTTDADRMARVWDVQAKHKLFDLEGHTDAVTGAAFSPNESRVITISADRTARVWELATGRFIAELRGHTDKLTSIAFSHNPAILVTGSSDATARVWDLSKLGSFKVASVTIKADPKEYTGTCPAFLRLLGSVTVAGGKGRIKCRFVRIRGELGKDERGPERELVFDSPGTKEVSAVWKFGGPNHPAVKGSFYLEVTSPQPLKSSEAEFTITCEDFTPDENSSLAAPEQLNAKTQKNAQSNTYEVTLNWLPVAGAEKYTVRWATPQSNKSSRSRFARDIDQTSYTIKNVSANTLTCYVWAVNKKGATGSPSILFVPLR
jgi:WD40 repeat protein